MTFFWQALPAVSLSCLYIQWFAYKYAICEVERVCETLLSRGIQPLIPREQRVGKIVSSCPLSSQSQRSLNRSRKINITDRTFNELRSVFHASVLLLTVNFAITSSK